MFRTVLEEWLRFERLNLDYGRMGLARYRMPTNWTTNQKPSLGFAEVGLYPERPAQIALGIRRLADAADCIGDQLGNLGDMRASIRAALLIDHLWRNHGPAFQGAPEWANRPHGRVSGRVIDALTGGDELSDLHAPIDEVQQQLDELNRVAQAYRRKDDP